MDNYEIYRKSSMYAQKGKFAKFMVAILAYYKSSNTEIESGCY